ncbi:MAG TPA: glycosyltransferase [Caldilineaceae bacterium]|nr:glycosyltransferase [Caldilineaceae bacterium]
MDVTLAPAPRVSVVMTVYNEAQAMERLLASLAEQRRRPDEVVICDGGSTDGTVAQIERWAAHHVACLPRVRVLAAPGANISRGRNIAIEAAEGPLIAVTDAGVRLDPNWLAELVKPWSENPTLQAVAGFFAPDVEGVFQTAMAATVLPLVDEIRPERFLPSSRSVAFTKAVWAAAGGYPEWLDYCEDLIFDFRINALVPDAPTGFAWAPRALVYFRPRESLRSFWTQYYRYARGDGKADLWRRRHAIRYATYGLLLPALIGYGLWGGFARWLGWLGLVAGAILYCRRPWLRLRRLGSGLTPGEWLRAAAWVPLIRVVGDVAKMAGYPVGVIWRWRNRRRPELDWRRAPEQAHGGAD